MTPSGKSDLLTPAHRRQFVRWLRHWRDRLGMSSWRTVLSNKHTRALADVVCFAPDRMAVVRLGRDWGSVAVNDETLSAVALHELMHVKLDAIHQAYLIEDEAARWDAIMAAEHEVINTFVWLLHPEMEGFE